LVTRWRARGVAPDIYESEDEAAGALRATLQPPAAAVCVRRPSRPSTAGLDVDLDAGLEIERTHFAALFAPEDQNFGMASFVENGS
jgi:hypothetical protein